LSARISGAERRFSGNQKLREDEVGVISRKKKGERVLGPTAEGGTEKGVFLKILKKVLKKNSRRKRV